MTLFAKANISVEVRSPGAIQLDPPFGLRRARESFEERDLWSPSAHQKALANGRLKISGVDIDEATPDPIPNSEVKLVGADGTAGGTLWESRTSPG